MEAKRTKTNQSVEKTMRLVEVMAESGVPMKLQDLAAAVNMPPSTTLRMVNTLLTLGYVNQDEESLCYYLSLKFSYIGECALLHMPLGKLVHPPLVKLAMEIQECVCFSMEVERELVCHDVFSGTTGNILTIAQRVGAHAPLYCTAAGKLLLTNYAEHQFRDYCKLAHMKRYTENTLNAQQLQAELEKIVLQGYALNREEYTPGVSCIAAPVRNGSGKIMAGLSIMLPSLRLTPTRLEELIPLVKSSADEISRSLSFR